jgi:hypothetical protein
VSRIPNNGFLCGQIQFALHLQCIHHQPRVQCHILVLNNQVRVQLLLQPPRISHGEKVNKKVGQSNYLITLNIEHDRLYTPE